MGAYRDDAISKVYWKYRSSKTIFHINKVTKGKPVEMVAQERKEKAVDDNQMGRKLQGFIMKKLEKIGNNNIDDFVAKKLKETMGLVPRRTFSGIDHDHVLVCGKEGFVGENDGSVKGKGLCQKSIEKKKKMTNRMNAMLMQSSFMLK